MFERVQDSTIYRVTISLVIGITSDNVHETIRQESTNRFKTLREKLLMEIYDLKISVQTENCRQFVYFHRIQVDTGKGNKKS